MVTECDELAFFAKIWGFFPNFLEGRSEMALKCATCPGPVVRRPGSRGPLPARCDGCKASAKAAHEAKAAAADAKAASRAAAREAAGPATVLAALDAELAVMPDAVQVCTEAAVARSLARQIDQGESMTASSKELTRVMTLLRAMAPAERAPAGARAGQAVEAEGRKGVTDIAARVAARRGQATG